MLKRWACKPTARRLLDEAGANAKELKASGVEPHLSVVLVGGDPASMVYVRNKIKACEELGLLSSRYELPEAATTEELVALIDRLNDDGCVHGI